MKKQHQTITIQWKWIAIAAITLLVIVWVRRRKEQEATATKPIKTQTHTVVYNTVSGGSGGAAAFTEYFNSVAGGTGVLYTTGTITEIVEMIRNGRLMQNNEYSFSGSMITLSIPTGSSVGASGLESFIVKYN